MGHKSIHTCISNCKTMYCISSLMLETSHLCARQLITQVVTKGKIHPFVYIYIYIL